MRGVRIRADGTDMAAIYIYCQMVRTPLGIGYMALLGFGANCVTGWMDEWSGVDTSFTAMTNEAPAVLKTIFRIIYFFVCTFCLTNIFLSEGSANT